MFDAADDEVARYRAFSSLALAGLLAGLLSPLVMFTPLFWFVPLAAVVLSGLALRRIATRRPDLVGRPLAVAGLMLGAVFLVAPPVDDLVYRYLLRQQARQFAEIWIDAVRHGEKFKAHHLMIDPRHREPLEDNLAEFYRRRDAYRQKLKSFVDEPTMRTLFALGEDAEIRFYETIAEDPQDEVQQIYAVTYRDEQEEQEELKRRTFFIALIMQRSIDTKSGRAGWTLIRVDGGVRPPGW